MSSHRRGRSRRPMATAIGLLCLLPAPLMAQSVPNSPAERAVTQTALAAIAKAGIDFRTTPVRVITTADRMVYVTGPAGNPQAIKVAMAAAAGVVPGYRVVTDVNFDPDHARATK